MSGKVFTIGYEGRNVDEFLNELVSRDIEQLIDVRQNAFSRKPGFSRSALMANLSERGISYHHMPELGSPREVRQNLKEGGTLATFLEEYSAHLDTRGEAYERLRELVLSRSSVIMCFEREYTGCHRSILADRLSNDGLQVVQI